MKRTLFVILLVACSSARTFAQETISMSLGGQNLPIPGSLIYFGQVPDDDTTQTYTVDVHNGSAHQLTLDAFSYGENLRAEWKSATPKPPATRTTIPPRASVELLVNVKFKSNLPQIPFVAISNSSKVLATIGMGYFALVGSGEHREVQQSLSSGLGEWWSPIYTLCLGAAGPHRSLEPSTAKFVIASVGGHPRSCVGQGYSECTPTQADDNNVCENFKVQGHHQPNGTHDGDNEVIRVNATLSALYKIVPDTPQIFAVTDPKVLPQK